MAYIYTDSNNSRVFYAADDSDKNFSNIQRFIDSGEWKEWDVSDADFEDVAFGKKWVQPQLVPADSLNLQTNSEPVYDAQASMDNDISKTVAKYTKFMENNPSHAKLSDVQAYINVLNGIDTSSLSYPLSAKSLPEYVNSIGEPYLHYYSLVTY